MSDNGWQQPPAPVVRKCAHVGALLAALSLYARAEGHEWVCTCGQVFVVVSNAGRDKRLVPRAPRDIPPAPSKWRRLMPDVEKVTRDSPCPRIIGNICPACLLKPCECPVDDSASRALLMDLAATQEDK